MFLHHIRLTQLSEQDLKKNTIDIHQLRLALLVLIFVEAWVYYHYNHITTPPTIVNLRANLWHQLLTNIITSTIKTPPVILTIVKHII